MTVSSSVPQEGDREKRDRMVRCPKCRERTPVSRNTCEHCGSHLHVSCRDCGERNERNRTRCKACGRRLHRPLFSKLLNRKLGRKVKITPLQIVMLLFAVALGYKMIVYFVESMSQTPAGDAAFLHVSREA